MTTAEAMLQEMTANMAKMAEFMVKMQTEMPWTMGSTRGGGSRKALEVRNIADKKFTAGGLDGLELRVSPFY